MSEIDVIAEKMRSCNNAFDTEEAHSKADDLLVDLIETLAKDTPHEEQVRLILSMYASVDKWYA